MNKHSSVFGLMLRSSLFQALALFAVLVIAEIPLFLRALNAALAEFAEESVYGVAALEEVVKHSRIDWIFAAVFLLLTLQLCRLGCEFGGKQGYTLRRLSVSERAVYLWQALANTVFYLLLWGIQALIVLGLNILYETAVPADALSNQTLFLAFWRSDFLHALLPVGDVYCLVGSLVLALCLGLSAAGVPFWQRRHKQGYELLGMAALAVLVFPRGAVDYVKGGGLVIAAPLLAAYAFQRVWNWKEVE